MPELDYRFITTNILLVLLASVFFLPNIVTMIVIAATFTGVILTWLASSTSSGSRARTRNRGDDWW